MDESVTFGEFAIRVEEHPDTLILVLDGELDLASAAQLEQQLRDAQTAGRKRVVIDLSRVTFMDSTGLHVLLEANERSSADGHYLSLLRGPRPVQRIFELTGTTGLFQFNG